jgi:hypothetical protein
MSFKNEKKKQVRIVFYKFSSVQCNGNLYCRALRQQRLISCFQIVPSPSLSIEAMRGKMVRISTVRLTRSCWSKTCLTRLSHRHLIVTSDAFSKVDSNTRYWICNKISHENELKDLSTILSNHREVFLIKYLLSNSIINCGIKRWDGIALRTLKCKLIDAPMFLCCVCLEAGVIYNFCSLSLYTL